MGLYDAPQHVQPIPNPSRPKADNNALLKKNT
jgi:hypothetical protein